MTREIKAKKRLRKISINGESYPECRVCGRNGFIIIAKSESEPDILYPITCPACNGRVNPTWRKK